MGRRQKETDGSLRDGGTCAKVQSNQGRTTSTHIWEKVQRLARNETTWGKVWGVV